MEPSCSKCNKTLPEVDDFKFRFCPHCGAEIAAEPRRLDDANLTIPPDPLPPETDKPPTDLSPQTEKKTAVAHRFDDQTIEPRPPISRQQIKLKPPETPPPAGFFRARFDEKTPAVYTDAKTSLKQDVKKQSATRKRNIIIGALVILALIILLIGGLFTF